MVEDLGLVCPRCRRLEPDGTLSVEPLAAAGPSLDCARCLRRYPVVDGVPIVVAGLPEWLEQERASVLARRDLPPALEALVLAGARETPPGRDRHLLTVYAAAEGDLPAAAAEVVDAAPGPVCDLGCGVGLHTRSDAVGLDLNFALARAFRGRGVVGDAADPPFLAHAFQTVLLLNLLDSCRDPRLVLGQADALLAQGGRLVVACPFAWDDRVTPPADRFEPDELLAALRGEDTRLELNLSYRLRRVEDALSWRLRQGPRTVHEHACQLVVAEKLGAV